MSDDEIAPSNLPAVYERGVIRHGVKENRPRVTKFYDMSKTARDPVPKAQEKVVIARSGNKCAYPGCGLELTIDPKSDEDQPKATGKVAHIAGASPNGPRYDSTMTPKQRGSADNLVYLCSPHHDAIDFQLGYHTRDFLIEAKQTHELAVARAVRNGLGKVSYEELEVVCKVIAGDSISSGTGGVELALPLQQKITLNNLGEASVRHIMDGLSQAARVEQFIAFQTTTQPNFGRRLAARFKSDYHSAVADGLEADVIFEYLVGKAYENSGPRDTSAMRAAALAVVAYLFELCEIFERE
ncbi:hypothetical protein CH262_03190 [Rhodococcus sp. 05-2255-1e]|uniref:ABC-three component systems C-terminal domain-containing protein n=1 Tax=Rhodococcoides fascians TaxID=1828 RepID=A0A143QTD5_RHOFA|nr:MULTISPECIES: ABC-three component system protein [Rhodococcus]AMY26280.1 hypothetical protein A3Q41_05025 [Rhodococcus fascians]OZC38189.1 hypothetical protein CHX23_24015 [Rhodococcus fascians]OZE28338.1 hypothetical protein CH262_03190 [Rhodococcus sp. 05-2255-1e]